MADRGLHALMVYWVKREKELQKARQKALDDGKTWFRRAKLALQKGRLDLAKEAKQRAEKAQFDFKEAERLLKEVESEKIKLQYESQAPTGEEVMRSHRLLADFKEMGIDPEFEELERAFESDKQDALEQLRARMRSEKKKNK